VWRDPNLVDANDHPICDSCAVSKEHRSQDQYHLFDFILVEEKVVTPEADTLVWRVATVVQVDPATVKIQLFERFSDRAKSAKDAGYVSEVCSRRTPSNTTRGSSCSVDFYSAKHTARSLSLRSLVELTSPSIFLHSMIKARALVRVFIVWKGSGKMERSCRCLTHFQIVVHVQLLQRL
jgi:hypothetical protein